MVKRPEDETLWSEFKKYFNAFVVNDVQKSLQAGLEVGTIILTTVGIECLSGYYAGDEADRTHFVQFMRDFMPPYAAYADDIYACIRNGLAHDYVIKENPVNHRKFLFKRDHGEAHLVPTLADSNVIYLSRATYAQDFLSAQACYFSKAESDQVVWDKAVQRLRHTKGFLTVRSESELVARSSGGGRSPTDSSAQAGSAMGSATGTSAGSPISS